MQNTVSSRAPSLFANLAPGSAHANMGTRLLAHEMYGSLANLGCVSAVHSVDSIFNCCCARGCTYGCAYGCTYRHPRRIPTPGIGTGTPTVKTHPRYSNSCTSKIGEA